MYCELGPWHRPFFFSFFLPFLTHSGFLFLVSLPVASCSVNRQAVSPFESHFLFRIQMLSSDLYPAYRFKPNTRRGSWSGLCSCYNIAYFSLESDQTMLSSVGTTYQNKKLMLTDSAKRLQNCIREGQKKKRKKKDPPPNRARNRMSSDGEPPKY